MNLLLIEDDPVSVATLTGFLRHSNLADYELVHANQLHEGLLLLEKHPFDLVLLDLGLRDSRGLGTLKIVRAKAPHVAIVIFSAETNENEILAAVKLGAQDYLVKGQIDNRILPRVIRHAIERKKMLDQLEASESLYRNIVELQSDIVIRWAPETRLTFVNRHLADLLGLQPQEIIGRNWMEMIPEEEHDRTRAFLQSMLENKTLVSVENTLTDALGHEHRILWNMAPLLNSIGDVIEVQGVGRDITKERQLAQRILESEEREKQKIAGILHDELGQTLTGTAFVSTRLHQLLAEEKNPHAAHAARITDNINSAIGTVRGLSSGMILPRRNLGGLAHALQRIGLDTSATYGIPCRVTANEPDESLGPEIILQLFRIAQESVHNAAKHSGCTNIEVDLAGDSSHLLLTIRDDGRGFNPELYSNGLGLDLMRHRANLVGGELFIQSIPGQGTEITCRLKTPSVSKVLS